MTENDNEFMELARGLMDMSLGDKYRYMLEEQTMSEQSCHVLLGECGPFHGFTYGDPPTVPMFDQAEVERIMRELEWWNGWDWVWIDDVLLARMADGYHEYHPDENGLYALLDPGWEFTIVE